MREGGGGGGTRLLHVLRPSSGGGPWLVEGGTAQDHEQPISFRDVIGSNGISNSI